MGAPAAYNDEAEEIEMNNRLLGIGVAFRRILLGFTVSPTTIVFSGMSLLAAQVTTWEPSAIKMKK